MENVEIRSDSRKKSDKNLGSIALKRISTDFIATLRELVEVCIDAAAAVSPVVNDVAPEGRISMDFTHGILYI